MRKEKNSLIVLLFLISAIFIVISVLMIINAVGETPLQSVEHNIFFIVAEGGIGVDVNDSLLTFGRTYPGGPGITRPVLITNDYNFPILIKVFVSENISSVLYVNSSYTVGQAENLTIGIRLEIPSDYEIGNYTGKIRFDLYEVT